MLPILRLLMSGVLFLVVLAARAEEASPRQAEVEKQLRELEQAIEKVRGLKFKSPVTAKVIARPKDTSEGVQGYYDTRKKALFLYDDIKGNYAKGVLVHEMVHALQDQHFGLAKLHSAQFDSDQELAMAALIEGDATYTMIELLQKEQPHVGKMLDTDLAKAKNLQNAFLYGQGAKFVRDVQKKGGWKAVDQRYRFRPTSTATILHPDQRISPVNLGVGKRIGEYGLLKMFHDQPATRALSAQVASGWRGDRLLEEAGGSAWTVAFATPDHARRFFDALAQLRQAEFPKIPVTVDSPHQRTWKLDKGGKRIVSLKDRRVHEVNAPNEAALKAITDRLEGPPKLAVFSARDKKTISFGEMIDRLMDSDFICVGESHDSELHHAVQLMILKGLFARDERLGVGMEMFQRPFQRSLDRYVSGSTDEPTFLEDSDYAKRWGFEWSLYRPIVEFCRRNRVPVAALNVPDELRKRLSAVGYEKLTKEEQQQLGTIDFQVQPHRQHWFERLGGLHGQQEQKPEEKERAYQVMTAWDEFMADSAAKFLTDRQLRRLVILAGSGHIEKGFGIPDRAAKRAPGRKSATVTIRQGGDPGKEGKDPQADYTVYIH